MVESRMAYEMERGGTVSSVSGWWCYRQAVYVRITAALAVNVTTSERLKPFGTHKYKKPQCFGKTFDPNSLVMYYFNKKAWMRTEVGNIVALNNHTANDTRICYQTGQQKLTRSLRTRIATV